RRRNRRQPSPATAHDQAPAHGECARERSAPRAGARARAHSRVLAQPQAQTRGRRVHREVELTLTYSAGRVRSPAIVDVEDDGLAIVDVEDAGLAIPGIDVECLATPGIGAGCLAIPGSGVECLAIAGIDVECLAIELVPILIASIARAADGEPGSVSQGTFAGEIVTPRASVASVTATSAFATRLRGRSFSIAISTAAPIIHGMLMIPRANSEAMIAQQHPTHHAPCTTPMRSAPAVPSRQLCSTKSSGARQRRRQASFAGVSWYAAAAS